MVAVINKERQQYEEQLPTVDENDIIDTVGTIKDNGLNDIDLYELGLFLTEDLGYNPFNIFHINN